MRVNVDSKALKDPRFKRMGRALAVHWYEALGLALEVWMYAYEQRSEFMSVADVDAVVARDGVGVAMLEAELAEAHGEQLRLCGVRKRIGYLLHQTERGRAGGKASAATRRLKKDNNLQANAQPPGKPNAQALSEASLKRDPSAPDQVPDQPQVQDQPLVLDLPMPSSSSATRSRAGVGTSGAIAFFCDQYKNKYGHACRVTDKAAGQIKQLEKLHGSEEVKRRTATLFATPPAFLAANAPDLGTLAQHFDKLVKPLTNTTAAVGRAEPATHEQHAADAARGAMPWTR